MFVHLNVNFRSREKGNQSPFEEIYQSEKSHFPPLVFKRRPTQRQNFKSNEIKYRGAQNEYFLTMHRTIHYEATILQNII